MTTRPAGPSGGDDPRPREVHGQPAHGVAGEMTGFAEGPDREVDVLLLAGQRLPAGGAWLLVTSVDGKPGGEFTAQVAPGDAPSAFGGDVVVRLSADDPAVGQPPPTARVQVFAMLGGRLIAVAAWPGHDLDGWPDRIRPAAAFAMGVLTELEEHGADLGAHGRVDLNQATDVAVAGIPLHLTFAADRAAAPTAP